MRSPRPVAAVVLLLALAPFSAPAQSVRPGDERPPLEDFEPEQAPEPELGLPPMPLPRTDERGQLGTGATVFVSQFRLLGNSVISNDELSPVLAPYANREITSEELIEARDAVTRFYIERGYVTSGALIPDQDVDDGIVTIRVIEGLLGSVSVEGAKHFRERYLRDRLELAMGSPVNIHDLEQRLQLIQQDERIVRVDAQLQPGEVLGESFLTLVVEEANPLALGTYAANDQPPSIGSDGLRFSGGHHNLTGNGDVLEGYYAGTDGLDEWNGRYALPINAHDTILELGYRDSSSEVVRGAFRDLGIESRVTSYAITLRHPVYRTTRTQIWTGLRGELRRGETEVAGVGFGFPGSGADTDGETNVSVLRYFQEWTTQGRSDVIAARSTFNFGLDVFNASDERDIGASSRTPDGTFISWLGQFQWAHRLSERFWGTQTILRADLQLSANPLFPMEKFAVGGMRTVRGYEENTLVRDNGFVSSLELRIPLLRDALGQHIVQLAPFADFGHSWNDHGTPSLKSLPSLGLGLRWRATERLLFAGYWGARLRDVERTTNNAQSNGFHFEASYTPY